MERKFYLPLILLACVLTTSSEPLKGAQFRQPKMLPDRTVQLELEGTAGLNYSIQASSDLKNWFDVRSLAAPATGPIRFIHSEASGYSHLFYRAKTNAPVTARDVTLELDTNRLAEALIPETGSQLSLTNELGVKFHLKIPDKALIGPERITMIAVKGVPDLPMSGGLLAGVDLKPEGLFLFVPAELTIEFPQAVDSNRLIGFAYRGEGKDFHLYPSEVGPNSVKVSLMHFSGYGVAEGTDADVKQQLERVPTGELDAANQHVAAIIWEAKQAGQSFLSGEFRERYIKVTREFFTTSLLPRLQASVTNCDLAKGTIPDAISWARAQMLLGVAEIFQAEIDQMWSFFCPALLNCANEAEKRCKEQHDFSAVTDLMQIAHTLAVMPQDCTDAEAVREKIRECVRFELDFESIIEVRYPDLPLERSHVRAQDVILTFETTGHFAGEGPLEYVQYIPGGHICDAVENLRTVGSRFKVLRLVFDANIKNEKEKEIVIEIDPGTPEESWNCIWHGPPRWSDPVQTQFWDTHFWYMNHVNQDEVDRDFDARVTFTDWSFVGERLFARKVIQQRFVENDGAVYAQTTTFDLFHAPLP